MNEDEKLTVKTEVPFKLDWSEIEIKDMKKDLDTLEKFGATEIEIRIEDQYGYTELVIRAYTNRLETDQEYATRINTRNVCNEMIRLRELAELERLKLKYNKITTLLNIR